MFKNKKGAFGFEKLGWMQKQWLFLFTTLLAGLFIFEFTTDMVSFVLNYRLELLPFFSIRNIVGILFGIFAILMYLNQIDYKEIRFLGFQGTYWIFLLSILLSGIYLFEPLQSLIINIINFRLDFFPVISIRNILGIMLFVIAYKIYKTIKP